MKEITIGNETFFKVGNYWCYSEEQAKDILEKLQKGETIEAVSHIDVALQYLKPHQLTFKLR